MEEMGLNCGLERAGFSERNQGPTSDSTREFQSLKQIKVIGRVVLFQTGGEKLHADLSKFDHRSGWVLWQHKWHCARDEG